MNQASQVVQTIYEQLKALGLDTNKYDFVASSEKTLKVTQGLKGVIISYDERSDTYTIEKYEEFNITKVTDGVFVEDLLKIIAPIFS